MVLKMTYAAVLAAFMTSSALAADEMRNPLTPSTTWNDLRGAVVGEVEPGSAERLLDMQAPFRAVDAARVPVVLRQIDSSALITEATVVIDENPSPVAATFSFGSAMGPLDFEMRVRVDRHSNIRVIAETPDGLHMTGRHVKATGGCSAPAVQDPQQALAHMGQMTLHKLDGNARMSIPRRQAQITIRHPNHSGLQRDQITHHFIPAHFIHHIEVWQGDDLLFTMEGGISISEDPIFRFAYDDNGATALTVKATDTDGNVFESVLPKWASG